MQISTLTVPARGIGRLDYSEGAEMSVEPTVSSYQSHWHYYDVKVIPALGSLDFDIQVPVGYILLLYGIDISIPAHHLLRAAIRAVDSLGVEGLIVDKHAYQNIEHAIIKGTSVPFILRTTIDNYRDINEVNCRVSYNGIILSGQQYYQTIGQWTV